MGDDEEERFLTRLTKLEKECGEAKTVQDLERCNTMLGSFRKSLLFVKPMSSLNRLRKDILVSHCSMLMKLFELSTCNAQRLAQEKMEKEDIKNVMVENMGLKSELLTDKRVIIDLQKQLISKSEVTVKEVEKTVLSELKSYSAIVKSSCYEALAPTKIERAVKRATVVADGRDSNLIVYGLPEAENEDCVKEVGSVLEVVGEKPPTITCVRIGAQKPDMIRPVKVKLRSSEQVLTVLRKSSKLKESENFKSVFLSRDYTVEERLARRQLVDELKKKKLEEPEKLFKIDFNKMVLVIRES